MEGLTGNKCIQLEKIDTAYMISTLWNVECSLATIVYKTFGL
jgi:hypothetical protein